MRKRDLKRCAAFAFALVLLLSSMPGMTPIARAADAESEYLTEAQVRIVAAAAEAYYKIGAYESAVKAFAPSTSAGQQFKGDSNIIEFPNSARQNVEQETGLSPADTANAVTALQIAGIAFTFADWESIYRDLLEREQYDRLKEEAGKPIAGILVKNINWDTVSLPGLSKGIAPWVMGSIEIEGNKLVSLSNWASGLLGKNTFAAVGHQEVLSMMNAVKVAEEDNYTVYAMPTGTYFSESYYGQSMYEYVGTDGKRHVVTDGYNSSGQARERQDIVSPTKPFVIKIQITTTGASQYFPNNFVVKMYYMYAETGYAAAACNVFTTLTALGLPEIPYTYNPVPIPEIEGTTTLQLPTVDGDGMTDTEKLAKYIGQLQTADMTQPGDVTNPKPDEKPGEKPGEETDPDTGGIDWSPLMSFTGLGGVMPFCIPFDIINMVKSLQAPPKAPIFEIPFEMPGLFSEKIVVDLSIVDSIMPMVRLLILLGFAIGLARATSSLIKW